MGETNLTVSIGILGGGQLGKMLAQAGADWNLPISILDPTLHAPASCCAKQTVGSFRNYKDVVDFGINLDLITVEIEDVNLEALIELRKLGKKVFPSPECLALIQDKGLQKLFYLEHQFPSADFILVHDKKEIIECIKMGKLLFPFVQKTRKAGYDGKGVQIIKHHDQLDQLFDLPSVVEKMIPVQKEIAVLASRNVSGQVKSYDAVEMIFHPTANLLLYQECPSDLPESIKLKARSLAENLIEKMDVVGLLAVEMFIDENGDVLINEVAPRPHNSGHHTIESCITSQYHQHWRAVLDMPLGDTRTSTNSILLNILGEEGYTGPARYQGLNECLAIPGVYIHLYGKIETKPFRKMGHVTICGHDLQDIKSKAKMVSHTLKVIA